MNVFRHLSRERERTWQPFATATRKKGRALLGETQGDHIDELKLPKVSYYLDESDPAVLVLRRQDGAFVSTFSAQGATGEAIADEAAREEDYGALVGEHVRCSGGQGAVEEERNA